MDIQSALGSHLFVMRCGSDIILHGHTYWFLSQCLSYIELNMYIFLFVLLFFFWCKKWASRICWIEVWNCVLKMIVSRQVFQSQLRTAFAQSTYAYLLKFLTTESYCTPVVVMHVLWAWTEYDVFRSWKNAGRTTEIYFAWIWVCADRRIQVLHWEIQSFSCRVNAVRCKQINVLNKLCLWMCDNWKLRRLIL